MTRSRPIPFAEFSRFLQGLGYSEKRIEKPKAWVFDHPTEGLLLFRVYDRTEAVDEGDLRSTRTFLDLRGLLEADDFDAFVQKASTPA